MKVINILMMIVFLGAISGCQTFDRHNSHEVAKATSCSEPRQKYCTRELDPVCGLRKDGTKMNFGNACAACAMEDIVAYQPGECE